MPSIHEFQEAIRNSKNDIAKLQAIKILLPTGNNTSIFICGLSYELINNNNLETTINLEIQRLENFIKECESGYQELEEIRYKSVPRD